MSTATQGFKTIDREGLKKKIDSKQNFRLWNVITRDYYKGQSIPGSQWIPANELSQKLSSLGTTPNDEIVVYCSSFTCPASKQAAQILAGSGYKNVYAFEGGIADWQEAGYPVVND